MRRRFNRKLRAFDLDKTLYNGALMKRIFLLIALLLSFAAAASPAYTACNPAGVAGQAIFNADQSTEQYCNDTKWVAFPRSPTSCTASVWTAQTTAEANSWFSVAYGGGQFVAVAYTGTHRVMTSPDGITWTARTAAEANQWLSVAYGVALAVQ